MSRRSEYRAPCLRWFHSERLNPAERVIFERVRAASRLLDFGAGDLRLKRKFIEAGFSGRYETLDISEEFPHEYTDLAQVRGPFGAILCLEVIEHLPLTAFESVIGRLCELLEPGGVLVLSTPNPLCVVPMWSRDSGHIQQYPLHDLIADFLARGLSADPYRVRLVPARPSLAQRRAPVQPARPVLSAGRGLRRRPARDRHQALALAASHHGRGARS